MLLWAFWKYTPSISLLPILCCSKPVIRQQQQLKCICIQLQTGKTARSRKIELKDPCISNSYKKARETERANRSIHPNYFQNPGQSRHSCPALPPQTACVLLLLQHYCLTPTNSTAAACWAGNLIHCKGCWQPEAAPLSIKYPVINYITEWGKGFRRERIKTQPCES